MTPKPQRRLRAPAAVLGSRLAMKPPRMLEQVRKAYRAEPFVPFFLHLADGRRIPVRERFFMALPPGSRKITVAVSDDAFDFIDARLVTDLTFKREPKKRRRTA